MKYGVKLTIIDKLDFNEFSEICEVIKSKGYKITIANNGVAVCEKEKYLPKAEAEE